MDHGGPSAGWYADPAGSPHLRWWDGYQWTAHLAAYPAATASVPQGTLALPGIGLPAAPAGSRQSTGTIVLAALVALVVLCGGLTAVATWPKRPHDETAGPIVAPVVPQGDHSTPTTVTPVASSTTP